jgi:hypothetical protein
MTVEPDDYNEAEMFTAPPKPKKAGRVNPLDRYKVGGVEVRLPTNGRFYKDFHPNLGGKIDVLPMRPHEQILMKSPDHLYSGSAVESLIAASVPAITNPKEVSIPDLDVLFLAVKLAGGDSNLELELTCPNTQCNKTEKHVVSIREALGVATNCDEDNSVRLTDELVAFVRPQNLATATKVSIAQYEEAVKFEGLNVESLPATELSIMKQEMFTRLTEVAIEAVVDCVLYIQTPDGIVDDPEFIGDFVRSNKAFYEVLDEKIVELGKCGVFPEGYHATCPHCKHEWDTAVTIDPSSFFG